MPYSAVYQPKPELCNEGVDFASRGEIDLAWNKVTLPTMIIPR